MAPKGVSLKTLKVYVANNETNRVSYPKIGLWAPIILFAKWLYGLKENFQENPGSSIKMAIAHSFVNQ